MKKVVIGFLGTKLDGGPDETRWERWRPSVAVFGHPELGIDQLELLVGSPDHVPLAGKVAADIVSVCPQARVRPHQLDIEDPWNFQQVYAALHEFAKSFVFEEDCEYFVHLTTGTHVAQICLFLLTEARYFPARILETYSHRAEEAWRGSVEVIDLNLATYDQLAKRFHKEREDSQSVLKGGIVTRNSAFNELIGRIEHVALRSSAPILLRGPTGAGKSQLAKRIFELRARRHLVSGSFVEVNAATLRGDNAMSALFGHKRGAYTGAAADRPGLLMAANKGVLFLDECGTLGLDEQAMLLRALETKTFLPLGSDKEVSSDFQLLLGTNLDLEEEVAKGRFRADLLARINLWEFCLPGLAERREDIEPNLDYELERVSRELGTHVTMTTEARSAFMQAALAAPWPGNFRDLAACVTRMATLCEGGRIGVEEARRECAHLLRHCGAAQSPSPDHPLAAAVLTAQRMAAADRFDLVQLEAVLQAVRGSTSLAEAGRQLFAASRALKQSANDTDRLRKYLAGWGLSYRELKLALPGCP